MLIDTTAPIAYRGLDLNDAELIGESLIGNAVSRILPGAVAGVGYTEKKAAGDGLNASDVWQAGRMMSMTVVTYAASLGDLSDRMQANVAALTPRSAYVESPGDLGFLPLQFWVPTARVGNMVINATQVAQWPTGEIECFVRARPRSQPEYVIDRDSVGGDGNDPHAIQWNVVFECIDPRIYISPRIDTNIEDTGAGDATYTLYNRGTYPTPLNIELVIPAAAGGHVVAITGAGTDMTLTIPTHATLERVVRVSSTDQIVTSQLAGGEQTLALSYLNTVANRVWPSIEPAGYAAVRVVNNKTLDTGSLIWYYEALA